MQQQKQNPTMRLSFAGVLSVLIVIFVLFNRAVVPAVLNNGLSTPSFLQATQLFHKQTLNTKRPD
jgi:hypothetical protein